MPWFSCWWCQMFHLTWKDLRGFPPVAKSKRANCMGFGKFLSFFFFFYFQLLRFSRWAKMKIIIVNKKRWRQYVYAPACESIDMSLWSITQNKKNKIKKDLELKKRNQPEATVTHSATNLTDVSKHILKGWGRQPEMNTKHSQGINTKPATCCSSDLNPIFGSPQRFVLLN